jgi:hypothetical protein
MPNFFNLWTALFPASLLALLVAGGTPNFTSLADVRRTFEEYKVPPAPSFSLANLMLTVVGDTQIPVDVHMTFNPVALFEIDFPQPANAAPIYVTAPGTQLPQNGKETDLFQPLNN